MKRDWHPFFTGLAMGLAATVVGFGIFDWQFYVIIFTPAPFYFTKPC